VLADARHPVAQDGFGAVAVVVGADVEDDRGFRIVELLDALQVERQRGLLLLGEDGEEHARRCGLRSPRRRCGIERMVCGVACALQPAEIGGLREACQLVAREAGVGGDARHLVGGELAALEERQAGIEAFGVVARPIGVDGIFIEQPRLVDPGLGEQALRRKHQPEAAPGDVVAFGMQPLAAAEAAGGMDRLGARRLGRDGRLVGVDDLPVGIAALLHQPGDGEEADIDLLLPAAHGGALLVGADRLLDLVAVAVALGEIEGVAGAQEGIGLALQRALQHLGVAAEGRGVAAARAIAVDAHDDVEVADRRLAVALDVFVQDALVVPAQAVADEMGCGDRAARRSGCRWCRNPR